MREYDELAGELAAGPVRIVGGRTKLGWGRATDPVRELSTRSLDRVLEHNEGDLTAVLQAGVPLADARAAFGEKGQMLALDPPDMGGATIGGIVAAGDSGPLRHRYGAARDLVLGVTVALSDGTVARAGGKVIKNVAGYDLAKLFAGSFGTLGAIVELSVRLHPLRPTASAEGRGDDPRAIARAASELAHSRLEAQALDLAWRGGRGGVLVRFAGSEAQPQAEAARRLLEEAGLAETSVMPEDAEAWEAQRQAQRGELVIRVSGLQTQLAAVMQAAERLGGGVVARAALGIAWVSLPADAGAEAVADLRATLAPAPCVVLDAPDHVRAAVDPWGLDPASTAVKLMRATKARFDPAGTLAPGVLLSES